MVQVRAPRTDAWTKTRRRLFLSELAATCNVSRACKAAGKTRGSVYELRYRDAAFAAAWDATLEGGYALLEAELLSTALGDVGDVGNVADADGDSGSGQEGAGQEGAEPPVPPAPFDRELAFRLLAQRRAAQAKGYRPRVHLRQPTAHEVLFELDKRLTAMERRRGPSPGVADAAAAGGAGAAPEETSA